MVRPLTWLLLASSYYYYCSALHISKQNMCVGKEQRTFSVSSLAIRNTGHVIIEPATIIANSLSSRRAMLTGAFSALIFTTLGGAPASAAADQDSMTDIVIGDYFAFGIPSTWKIITKPSPLMDKKTQKKIPTLFSAIDFQSGSVLTVVQEQACNVREYAQSDENTCDFVLPPSSPDEETTVPGASPALMEWRSKDLSKLLIRHDDRDNAILQGTSRLDSYSVGDKNKHVATLSATTTLPSGGTYTDGMGIDRPNTIDRNVMAKSIIVVDGGDGKTKMLSLWLSAPADEWQKPVMGTKLRQIWKSVKVGEKGEV